MSVTPKEFESNPRVSYQLILNKLPTYSKAYLV